MTSKIGKIGWRSRRLYRTHGRLGKVIYSEALKRYLLEDTHGNLYQVDQEFAIRVREVEERINGMGRPPVVPGETPVLYGLTLPQRLWDKLGRPYSANLARLLEGR